jgi:hypothetical protein
MSTEMEALFSSAARVQILSLFLTNPGQKYYQRQIERETGQPIRAVQREVKRLADIHLLDRETKGNRVFHGVNRDFVLLNELTALFQKAGLIEELVEAGSAIAGSLPKPLAEEQPFDWMEPSPFDPFPAALRRLQLDGEWDQAY